MKVFNNNNLPKRDLRTVICLLSTLYGVNKVTFNNKSKQLAGTYNAHNKNIFIDSKQPRRRILLTFFHELSHHIAVEKRLWMKYHLDPGTPLISPQAKFKIENKIDQMASKLWNKHVDRKAWGKYEYGYPQSDKKSLTAWLA
jgi:Zn-dependent peptidase ImmA (M78 family)